MGKRRLWPAVVRSARAVLVLVPTRRAWGCDLGGRARSGVRGDRRLVEELLVWLSVSGTDKARKDKEEGENASGDNGRDVRSVALVGALTAYTLGSRS